MLHHTKSCQQVLPLGSAPAALALRCVCSSVPPPCMGQAPAGLSHTAGTSLHKWLLLFLGSQRCHSQSPVCSCSHSQSQPLLGSNRHNPKQAPNSAASAGQQQTQPQTGTKPCSLCWLRGAAAQKDTQESLKCPSRGLCAPAGREGRNRIMPRRAEDTVAGDSKAAASAGYHTQGAARSKRCVPHRHTGCCIQDSQETPAQKTEKPWSNYRLRETPHLFELGQPNWAEMGQIPSNPSPWVKPCPM